ncbi:hypothetical protein H2201_008755 [Coniosporium apollinis]|uniref:Programmed cell death protein 2 C-terminal domain-containing protein n=1 Tax=Coniosporium apollinis TaxID=61459 RepID=A0ABQ9NG62_9PEZI|nr:hypothetical protein H2201_008755 [Coniosporium apollinis]
MASYDSDSSAGEDDYTQTNVLLGYATKEPTDDPVNQLGGHPTWLDSTTAPSGALAKCKVCNSLMSLLLQLNGDMPERFPGHERRLYLFACRRKTCRRKDGSVRGIRGTRVAKGHPNPSRTTEKTPEPQRSAQKDEEPKPASQNIGASLFGVASPRAAPTSTNPFSTGTSAPSNSFSSTATTSASANPFSTASALAAKPAQKPDPDTSTLPETFAQKVRISSPPPSNPPKSQPSRPHEPWPPQSSFPPPYSTYNLDADYETLDAPSTPAISANARMDLDAEASASAGGGEDDKTAFESSMDKTFRRFADRLAQNPEQVLRYEWAGQPLLYSKVDAVGRLFSGAQQQGGAEGKVRTAARGSAGGMPRCGNCGAERVFELQLVPQAIAELETEEVGVEGMEWGTVILGVCARDCCPKDVEEGQVGYLEEWVGVQWE